MIIPFRNENDNLVFLLKSLNNQSYPANLYEIIAVDDHSTDETALLIDRAEYLVNVKFIDNKGEGKKSALRTGVLNSNGQLIVTIDADCIPKKRWLETIAKNYVTNNFSMMAGPVKMVKIKNLKQKPKNTEFSFFYEPTDENVNISKSTEKTALKKTFLSRFQTIEYMSLQMCGAGAILLNKSVYCSGANLAFDKNDWLDVVNDVAGKKSLSGDDVFLLHAFKKKKKKIGFIKDKNAIINTKIESNFLGFLKQRMRWGAKSIYYNDLATIFLTMVVFFCNLFLTVSIVTAFFLCNFYLLFFLLIKMISDFILLKQGADFYGIKMPFYEFIAFSVLYPFYLTVTALCSLFINVSWKGRKIKQ